MKNSKIKSVQNNGSYQSKFDGSTMYTFEIQLEDGEVGEVSAKTEDRWKEGDEVEYTCSPSKFGNKLKLNKPGSQSFGSRKPDDETLKRIENSWAIKTAIQLHGQLEDDYGTYMSRVMVTASDLLRRRDSLSKELPEVYLDDPERPSASKWTKSEIDAMDIEAESEESSLPF
jgi:hypothetical protein